MNTATIRQLEIAVMAARQNVAAAATQLERCRSRRSRAEGRLATATVATASTVLAEALADAEIMSRLEPGLIADLERATRGVSDAETDLEEARLRVAKLEAAAVVPEPIAQAQAELAQLTGRAA